jgi:uncharacterized protein (TIGR03435 family)
LRAKTKADPFAALRDDNERGGGVEEMLAGPTFQQALAQQDGLKLVPGKGPMEVTIVDHIERPSAN